VDSYKDNNLRMVKIKMVHPNFTGSDQLMAYTVAIGVAGEPMAPGKRRGGAVSKKR
jgi:hypothetical protein